MKCFSQRGGFVGFGGGNPSEIGSDTCVDSGKSEGGGGEEGGRFY